jgi:transcriptional antiterminator NusG
VTAQWYIINTLSGFEAKVANLIRENADKKGVLEKFEEIVVPTESVTETKKGKKVTSERKIFPGYVLIKMELSDLTWNLVKNIPRVAGFLGGSGKPQPISDMEVKRVLTQIKEGAKPKEVELTFEMGETVKIIDGPFETFSGVVDEVDGMKKKLKISVSIFGRPTPVELEFSKVEKLK